MPTNGPPARAAEKRKKAAIGPRALLGAVGACALLAAAAASFAQRPELLQTLPRAANGKPDLSGVWQVLIAYQFAGAARTIYMSGHIEAPVESWMGWSNGRWEGDTLVVEVTGQNGQTWLDRAGNFGGEGLRVVERYTPLGPNHLYYEARLENPQVFARPWTIGMPLYRRVEPSARLLEFKCPEFAEELMYGDLRKPADAGEGDRDAER